MLHTYNINWLSADAAKPEYLLGFGFYLINQILGSNLGSMMVCNNNGLFQIDLTMADELEAADRWNKIQIQMEIQIQTQLAKQIHCVRGFREPSTHKNG